MTDSGDRLDRIEAALDRQVAVNADLRTSVEILKASTAELSETVSDLSETVSDLSETASALLQVVTIHQQNFEQLTTEINADRLEWRSQIERIWEYLQQRGNTAGTS